MISLAGKITRTIPWNHGHTSGSRQHYIRPEAQLWTETAHPPALNCWGHREPKSGLMWVAKCQEEN